MPRGSDAVTSTDGEETFLCRFLGSGATPIKVFQTPRNKPTNDNKLTSDLLLDFLGRVQPILQRKLGHLFQLELESTINVIFRTVLGVKAGGCQPLLPGAAGRDNTDSQGVALGRSGIFINFPRQ